MSLFEILYVKSCIENIQVSELLTNLVTRRLQIMPDHFWINPFAKSFRYMRPEDLCLVDEKGIVKPEGNMHAINPAGFAIHAAVHQARPDVISAVHCHSIPTKAFSALGCKLEPINQDACR